MTTSPNPSEHRAIGWAAIGAALVAIGGVGGGTLATVGAGSHLWADKAFLAGFAVACFLTAAGVYVLIAEFIGGLPLPPTRHEREARRRSEPRRWNPSGLLPPPNPLLAAMKELEGSRDLKDLLREGLRLKGILDTQEDSKPPHKDDPVYHWARATWVALQHQRPLVAKNFFGDKCPYTSAYFATVYGIEVDRIGRRAYLDGRIAILAAVAEPAVPERSDLANVRQQTVLRRLAEPPLAAPKRRVADPAPKRRPTRPQPKRSSDNNALVAQFVEVRLQLAVIREQIAPPKSYASSASFLLPMIVARGEEKARLLARSVRFRLANGGHTWCVERFDEGLDLPPAGNLPGIAGTATKDDLVTFIDEKREALSDIIEHLGTGGSGTGGGDAAKLARLYKDGCIIRDGIATDGMEPWGELIGRVRGWERSVQEALDEDAPESLIVFNAGAGLREPAAHLIAVQASPSQRKVLVEFIERRLKALEAIIAELRDGR